MANQDYCSEHFNIKMLTTIGKKTNSHFSYSSLTAELIEQIHIERNSAFPLKTANTMHITILLNLHLIDL